MIRRYLCLCARSEDGLSRLPVTEEIAGSNPVGRAKFGFFQIFHPLGWFFLKCIQGPSVISLGTRLLVVGLPQSLVVAQWNLSFVSVLDELPIHDVPPVFDVLVATVFVF